MDDLVDKIICPYCSYWASPISGKELLDVQGSIKCLKCGNSYYYDSEIIVFYKTYKTREEYIAQRLPVCEHFRLMGADFDDEHM